MESYIKFQVYLFLLFYFITSGILHWMILIIFMLFLWLFYSELGGKDVEDLFTAVLSPATTQPAALPQPPHPPQLLPMHNQGMLLPSKHDFVCMCICRYMRGRVHNISLGWCFLRAIFFAYWEKYNAQITYLSIIV